MRKALFLAVLVVSGSVSFAQQPAETLPGFKPNNVVESRGIDNVNLFNGDPGVAVPLGPEYPLGPGFEWQLAAHYSVKFWKFDRSCGIETGIRHAYVSGYPTLGAGWTLDLGYVSTGPEVASIDLGAAGVYVSPDGGRHPFFGASSPYLTKDGSRLRVTRVSSQHWEIEFPDGIRQIFAQPYERPRPTPLNSSYDFSDVDWDLRNFPSNRVGLTSIENSFDTVLLTVSYHPGSWRVNTITLNPAQTPRTINFFWTTRTVVAATWDVLSSIQFPATGARTLTASSAFINPSVFLRNEYDTSADLNPAGNGCNVGNTVSVPLLDSITLSDPSDPTFQNLVYRFTYWLPNPWDVSAGALQKITLPTGGMIDYKYRATATTCFGTACPADLEAMGEDELPLPGSTEDPGQRDFSRFWDDSAGVSSRKESDPYTGVISDVLYSRLQQVPVDSLGQTEDARITRRTIVSTPTGNAEPLLRATKYLFNVVVDPGSYGAGVQKVRRDYATNDSGGTPIRSVVFCHESDSSGSVCGYKDSSGTIQTYGLGHNTRLQSEVTWYGPDPAGGGTCSVGSVLCTASTNTSASYNATAQRYGTTVLTTTLPGMPPAWQSRETTTAWAPTVDATHWLLDLYSSKTIEDVETAGQLPVPRTLTSSYTFNVGDGFLERVTTSDASAGTLIRDFTKDALGNPQIERTYGQGGLLGDFTDVRGHENGLVTLTQRSGISWRSFDVTRDPDTGLITQSRDPNGLATNYEYDALGRLILIGPPGGELPTRICYLAAVTGNPAFTIVKKTSGDPCVRDDGAPAVGSGAFEGYQYDGLGRPIREIRRLPNVLSGGSYSAKRETRYEAGGNRSFISEWTPCPISSYPSTSISNCAFPIPQPQSGLTGTTWSSFDPFGRAETVNRADGSTTTISRADGSVAY